MGRTRENKATVITEVQELFQDAQMTMVIDYQGLTVAEITDLRNRLRPLGGTCKIAKNTLVRRALAGQEAWSPMEEFLTGTTAIVVLKDDLGGAIKAYKKFQKDTKKTQLKGGVLEGKSLSQADVEAIGDLPSKEQLMGQIAGGINALATKIALGIKEVPASVARGLQAHVDKE
ncbi:50S ribosomal protein L10 [Synechocystis salina LEGE 06155]|uniref:Large ribosomal subunit protein uL10 n=1 Tax=Synechocystis salina LEGE 00031 TaxID=1828736 RepID=A0ABR9VLW8_9SYNC|nr:MULTISPECIES: 50S ribosomal protein L10 [Synechocystis]MBE9175874.1 50S ribosomal protein L10 [Synechocystis salina LEGE 06155]MBD2654483.1 50S ribosomal protein L10 [Synechocystis sp. FACHB-383]MBE9194612.1 50S ribosomal protein L10 [Synechocystis sp. LEGE 06083]MBE9204372.1 50S ribosomal protein L10 [Synechocystis salina LEGE 06099]MBE9239509.1 50S ribosomal protein L10 [Synechocystis salina LEGE 00041]